MALRVHRFDLDAHLASGAAYLDIRAFVFVDLWFPVNDETGDKPPAGRIAQSCSKPELKLLFVHTWIEKGSVAKGATFNARAYFFEPSHHLREQLTLGARFSAIHLSNAGSSVGEMTHRSFGFGRGMVSDDTL